MSRRLLLPVLAFSAAVGLGAGPPTAPGPIQDTNGGPVTIHAARLLDGRGKQMTDATIEVRGSKIVAIDQRKGPYTHDLGNVTLMPGMIDVHTHIIQVLRTDGGGGRATPEQQAAGIAENLRAMMNAGFTTIQSVGVPGDKALREGTANGTMVGPRILTSLGTITNGTPDEIRARVRQLKADGADLIKIIASASIRDWGGLTMSNEQIKAACDESKAQGLRSLVHAQGPESVIATVKAGCYQVEHGMLADDEGIRLMAQAHVYLDPNIGLLLQNYFEHRDIFARPGSNFGEQGYEYMERAKPIAIAGFKKALAAGIKMPMGTDAVAGAHGQNARETIVRVKEGGQKPMDGIIGTTSLAAESMNMGNTIGTLAPGYEADIIAVSANPLTDIEMLRSVVFVMRGGKLHKVYRR
jgi:imidazolonepropionase-like amidohydrolase